MNPSTLPSANRQSGFTMVIILGLLMVLTIMGGVAVHSVRGEVGHAGRDSNHARAQLVAESALNWAISALQKDKPNVLAFTAATHASNGTDRLPEYLENGVLNNRKLHTSDMTALYPTAPYEDKDGWITETTEDPRYSLTGATQEAIAFKIWYPDDSTLRIQGRGDVDGSSADVDLVSRIRDIAIPME